MKKKLLIFVALFIIVLSPSLKASEKTATEYNSDIASITSEIEDLEEDILDLENQIDALEATNAFLDDTITNTISLDELGKWYDYANRFQKRSLVTITSTSTLGVNTIKSNGMIVKMDDIVDNKYYVVCLYSNLVNSFFTTNKITDCFGETFTCNLNDYDEANDLALLSFHYTGTRNILEIDLSAETYSFNDYTINTNELLLTIYSSSLKGINTMYFTNSTSHGINITSETNEEAGGLILNEDHMIIGIIGRNMSTGEGKEIILLNKLMIFLDLV